MARTILLFHIISARPSKQPLRVRTFLKVYMELGSYFLFLQEQVKDIIITQEEEEEEEDLFVFNDTIEGPRAPAVKPGRITQA